jgi:hypothetical protein
MQEETAPDETIYGEIINHIKAKVRIMFGAPCKAKGNLVEMQLAGHFQGEQSLTKTQPIAPFQSMIERRCLAR